MGAINWKDLATILALVLSIISIGKEVYKAYKIARAPGEDIRTRVQRLEEAQRQSDTKLKEFGQKVDDVSDRAHKTAHELNMLQRDYGVDHKKMEKLEEGQTAILYGIDALLDNAINGNNMEGLRNAQKHVKKHMIEG